MRRPLTPTDQLIMRSCSFSASALVVAILACLWMGRANIEPRPPYVQGQNNTVLFVANREHGLSNVFIATVFAILENHPDIQVHYASWGNVRKKLHRVSSFVKYTNPLAKDAIFHELKGVSYSEAIVQNGLTFEGVLNRPGWRGIGEFANNMQLFICPWEPDDHFDVYKEVGTLIAEIDPAVVVVDSLFRPALDATRDRNRQHIILTPNTHVDNFLAIQPWGSMFWKYPALVSCTDSHPYIN